MLEKDDPSSQGELIEKEAWKTMKGSVAADDQKQDMMDRIADAESVEETSVRFNSDAVDQAIKLGNHILAVDDHGLQEVINQLITQPNKYWLRSQDGDLQIKLLTSPKDL